jgi:hypothetical protein
MSTPAIPFSIVRNAQGNFSGKRNAVLLHLMFQIPNAYGQAYGKYSEE